MIIVIVLGVLMIGLMGVLAHRLAIYVLPALLALGVAHIAQGTGAGWMGAGIAGLMAGSLSFGALAVLFATARTPILRAVVALIFVGPAAAAGYFLVSGMTDGVVTSALWRHALCLAGGAFVGRSAFARLATAGSAGKE